MSAPLVPPPPPPDSDYCYPPASSTVSRQPSTSSVRSDDSDAEVGGSPLSAGGDDGEVDSDLELMSAAAGRGQVGARLRAGSSATADSSDDECPPLPRGLESPRHPHEADPAQHTRRKSALNVFGSEISQSFDDLHSRIGRGGSGAATIDATGVASPVAAPLRPINEHHVPTLSVGSPASMGIGAAVAGLRSPLSPASVYTGASGEHAIPIGRGASGSVSISSSSYGMPPSPASVTPMSRSNSSTVMVGSAPSALQGAASAALSPMLQRRGSDFRQRVGSVPLLPAALYNALSPGSSNGSNKNQCAWSGCVAFAARNAYCLRHVWHLSVEELEPVNQKQYQVAKEMVTTEKSYSDGLRVVWKSFLLRIHTMAELEPQRPMLAAEELQTIFHNIEDLYKLADNLYSDLEEITLEKVLTTQIGTTLLHYAPQFRIYQTYLENYDDAIRTLGAVRRDRPEFDFFCKLQEKCEGMSLESFLIMPVQRLPRYLLLLQELIKRSESATSVPEGALADMISAKDKIGNIANAINASLHQKENQIKVAAIQARFERDSRYQDLATPTRFLVREGPLKKRYGKGTRHLASSTVYHFFLFNDVLVYADFSKNVIGRGVTYKLKHLLPIADMTVEPTSSAKGKNKDILVTTKSGGSTKSFELSCADTADRDSWLAAIQGAIAKLNEDNKNLKSATFDGSTAGAENKASKSSKLKAMMGV